MCITVPGIISDLGESWVGCPIVAQLVRGLTDALALHRWHDALALLPCIALRSYPQLPVDYSAQIAGVLVSAGILQQVDMEHTLQKLVPDQTLSLLTNIVEHCNKNTMHRDSPSQSLLDPAVGRMEVVLERSSKNTSHLKLRPVDKFVTNAYRGLLFYMRWRRITESQCIENDLNKDSVKINGGISPLTRNSVTNACSTPNIDESYVTNTGSGVNRVGSIDTELDDQMSDDASDNTDCADGVVPSPSKMEEIDTVLRDLTEDLNSDLLGHRASTLIELALSSSNVPCEWLFGPLLEVVHHKRGSTAAKALISSYLAKHTGHTPALRTALKHVQTYWPDNTSYHVILLMKIQHLSASDDSVLNLVQILIEDPKSYVTDGSKKDINDVLVDQLRSDDSSDQTVPDCVLMEKDVSESYTFCVQALVELLHFSHWQTVLRPWELLHRALVYIYRAWIRCWHCSGCKRSRNHVLASVDMWWRTWWLRGAQNEVCLQTSLQAKLLTHKGVVGFILCIVPRSLLTDWFEQLKTNCWIVLANELRDTIKLKAAYQGKFKSKRRVIISSCKTVPHPARLDALPDVHLKNDRSKQRPGMASLEKSPPKLQKCTPILPSFNSSTLLQEGHPQCQPNYHQQQQEPSQQQQHIHREIELERLSGNSVLIESPCVTRIVPLVKNTEIARWDLRKRPAVHVKKHRSRKQSPKLSTFTEETALPNCPTANESNERERSSSLANRINLNPSHIIPDKNVSKIQNEFQDSDEVSTDVFSPESESQNENKEIHKCEEIAKNVSTNVNENEVNMNNETVVMFSQYESTSPSQTIPCGQLIRKDRMYDCTDDSMAVIGTREDLFDTHQSHLQDLDLTPINETVHSNCEATNGTVEKDEQSRPDDQIDNTICTEVFSDHDSCMNEKDEHHSSDTAIIDRPVQLMPAPLFNEVLQEHVQIPIQESNLTYVRWREVADPHKKSDFFTDSDTDPGLKSSIDNIMTSLQSPIEKEDISVNKSVCMSNVSSLHNKGKEMTLTSEVSTTSEDETDFDVRYYKNCRRMDSPENCILSGTTSPFKTTGNVEFSSYISMNAPADPFCDENNEQENEQFPGCLLSRKHEAQIPEKCSTSHVTIRHKITHEKLYKNSEVSENFSCNQSEPDSSDRNLLQKINMSKLKIQDEKCGINNRSNLLNSESTTNVSSVETSNRCKIGQIKSHPTMEKSKEISTNEICQTKLPKKKKAKTLIEDEDKIKNISSSNCNTSMSNNLQNASESSTKKKQPPLSHSPGDIREYFESENLTAKKPKLKNRCSISNKFKNKKVCNSPSKLAIPGHKAKIQKIKKSKTETVNQNEIKNISSTNCDKSMSNSFQNESLSSNEKKLPSLSHSYGDIREYFECSRSTPKKRHIESDSLMSNGFDLQSGSSASKKPKIQKVCDSPSKLAVPRETPNLKKVQKSSKCLDIKKGYKNKLDGNIVQSTESDSNSKKVKSRKVNKKKLTADENKLMEDLLTFFG